MLTIKTINGVGFCPICNKPTICHNASIESRALFWALSGDTGNSSRTIAGHMTGNPTERHTMPPSDASDRGRCIRLLELIPEWIPRLPELAREKPQEGIVINSSGISTRTNGWADQIPLIIKEGKF
jgi:hypothetical protein